jgi:DNA-binding NtrC family response regulator
LTVVSPIVTAERNPLAMLLIVEDDVFIRLIAELMVKDMGHDTLPASDIDEALLLLRSPQHFDALLTDIRLKTAALGGYELAHQAIKLRPKLPVLYMTGNSITEEMRALFVEGARFLEKPYTQHQLQDSVEELLAASF